MKLNCRDLFVLLFLFFTSPSLAQQSPDSVLYRESVYKIHQVYLSEIGDNAQIFHGSEFIRNGQKAIGFPFYEADNMLSGAVSYQGNMFMNLNLYYNLVSDEVVTNNYTHDALITLANEKVDSFTIDGHSFVRLFSTKSNNLGKTGFYEKLYPGEPSFFVRREKRLVTGSGSDETRYVQYNYYFIRMKNIFYQVEDKNTLLDVLKDQKDILKKYIRANKLNFKKHAETALLLTTIYYSQLKH